MNDVKQILVITLSNIGDVVLTLPVIGALKENFKEALIDVVVGTRAKEVLEADPRIDRMYVYDKSLSFIGKFKFLLGLRKKSTTLSSTCVTASCLFFCVPDFPVNRP